MSYFPMWFRWQKWHCCEKPILSWHYLQVVFHVHIRPALSPLYSISVSRCLQLQPVGEAASAKGAVAVVPRPHIACIRVATNKSHKNTCRSCILKNVDRLHTPRQAFTKQANFHPSNVHDIPRWCVSASRNQSNPLACGDASTGCSECQSFLKEGPRGCYSYAAGSTPHSHLCTKMQATPLCHCSHFAGGWLCVGWWGRWREWRGQAFSRCCQRLECSNSSN